MSQSTQNRPCSCGLPCNLSTLAHLSYGPPEHHIRQTFETPLVKRNPYFRFATGHRHMHSPIQIAYERAKQKISPLKPGHHVVTVTYVIHLLQKETVEETVSMDKRTRMRIFARQRAAAHKSRFRLLRVCGVSGAAVNKQNAFASATNLLFCSCRLPVFNF